MIAFQLARLDFSLCCRFTLHHSSSISMPAVAIILKPEAFSKSLLGELLRRHPLDLARKLKSHGILSSDPTQVVTKGIFQSGEVHLRSGSSQGGEDKLEDVPSPPWVPQCPALRPSFARPNAQSAQSAQSAHSAQLARGYAFQRPTQTKRGPLWRPQPQRPQPWPTCPVMAPQFTATTPRRQAKKPLPQPPRRRQGPDGAAARGCRAAVRARGTQASAALQL